ncbi:MAG: Thiol-disulfide oxidoreductase ResA [Myxococcota bacterium]|nr:Thiol-disulfide oxidoreductase ResA [Myxococcota bacterium]
MRKYMISLGIIGGLAAAVTVATLFSIQSAVADEGGAEVGKPAPAFTLKDETGKAHSLKDYAGKIVVLEWTNPKCPFVERVYENKRMTSLAASYKGNDKVIWLAVDSSSYNTPEKSKEWKKKHGFAHPTLQDPEGITGKAYGAKTTPHMYVVDEKGVLRYAGAFDDDAKGKSEKPKNYVQAAVDALLKGEAPKESSVTPWGCSVKYK